MPSGIFIFTEKAEKGLEIKARYPQDLKIEEKTLNILKISHSTNKIVNFSNVTIGNSKFASLYTGSNSNYFISLLLKNEEDPIIFENILTFISKKIIKNLSDDKYKDFLPDLFNHILLYPNFKEDQKLAIAYNDEIKRLIISKLVENVYIFRKDLENWLKEKLSIDHLDIDSVINSLSKLGLVKKLSVEGFSDEFVFLIGDFFITRVPPSNIIELVLQKQIPEYIAQNYVSKVKNYFQDYSPTNEDADIISEIFCDLDSYQLLKLLRLSPASKKGIKKVVGKLKDIDETLNKLQSIKSIEIFKDKQNNEHYFLITDLRIQKFFPEYLLNKILENYNNKSIPESFLIEYLKNLKDTYQTEMERIKKEEEYFEEWKEVEEKINKESVGG
ncbi:MAG: hypothetical protein HWN67_17190 [Candidatus Helarchaeota archaeon]|nr:hypothetical protein [Candidatus Helarchaeota archaeon]